MADQDFNITIKTIADTTGIKLTQQGLDAIKISALQGNKQAIAAMQNLTAASRQAQSAATTGFTGSAVGIGTITSLLTLAINRVQAFNAEQDNILEKMSEVTRKNYELAQSILATKDAEIEARRLGAEPLGDQYIQLQQKLIRLKTEQNSLNLPAQSKEWNDLQKDINETGKEIDILKSKLERSGITDVTPKAPGPKARKGESQALVDEIERNRKAAEESLKEDIWEFDPETGGYKLSGKKQFPTFQPPPPPGPSDFNTPTSKQYPSPIGPPMQGFKDLIKQAFEETMSRYWGP